MTLLKSSNKELEMLKGEEINKNKKAIGWLSLAHLVNDAYAGFLNPIMPFIAVKIGITMAIATVIMSIAQVCASMIQPIMGFWADNMLKRAFVFWGLIFGSVFVPLAANTPSVWILTICVILGNLGGSFFHSQALGFISRFSKMNFVANMGTFISAGVVGYSMGPLISAYVAQHLGFEKVPYLAIIGILIALVMFKCVPKISASGEVIEHKYFKESFKIILTNRSMNILIVISMAKALITNSATILLPFLWKDAGHNPTYIGSALFGFLLMAGIGSFVSSKIEQKIGAKKVFYISLIATLPIMAAFLMTYKTHPILSVAIFMIMGFTTMLAQPVMIVMAQRILPDYKSIVSGFINGFSWGVVAVFLTIIGFLAQNFGIAKVLLIVSCVPVLFSYFIKFLPETSNSLK